MIKLLLTLLILFAFGTSTINAEENTTSIEDRVSELAEAKPDSQSTIKAKVDELSEDELKAVIANVDELAEPTEDDLATKEAVISKLELSPLAIRMGIIGLVLMLCAVIIGHRIPYDWS